jgi:hypothetical protein
VSPRWANEIKSARTSDGDDDTPRSQRDEYEHRHHGIEAICSFPSKGSTPREAIHSHRKHGDCSEVDPSTEEARIAAVYTPTSFGTSPRSSDGSNGGCPELITLLCPPPAVEQPGLQEARYISKSLSMYSYSSESYDSESFAPLIDRNGSYLPLKDHAAVSLADMGHMTDSSKIEVVPQGLNDFNVDMLPSPFMAYEVQHMQQQQLLEQPKASHEHNAVSLPSICFEPALTMPLPTSAPIVHSIADEVKPLHRGDTNPSTSYIASVAIAAAEGVHKMHMGGYVHGSISKHHVGRTADGECELKGVGYEVPLNTTTKACWVAGVGAPEVSDNSASCCYSCWLQHRMQFLSAIAAILSASSC